MITIITMLVLLLKPRIFVIFKLTIMLIFFLSRNHYQFVYNRYLTGSKNSTFSKYFVYDAKLCGDVSYSRFSNSVEGFEIDFSNVNKNNINSIRPAFDRLIRR